MTVICMSSVIADASVARPTILGLVADGNDCGNVGSLVIAISDITIDLRLISYKLKYLHNKWYNIILRNHVERNSP